MSLYAQHTSAALGDRLRDADAVTAEFMADIVSQSCRRFPSAGQSGKSSRVERLICVNGGPVPMAYDPVVARVRDPELYHRRVAELGEGLRRWNQFTIDAFYQFEIARHTFAAAMRPEHYDDALALGDERGQHV